MIEKTVGILLTSKDWNKTINGVKNSFDDILFEYADYGRLFEFTIYYFNMDEINMLELKGRAFVVEEDSIIEFDSVEIPSIIYNPTKYTRRKNIRILNDLAKSSRIIINEHSTIPNHVLADIISSQKELENLSGKQEEQLGTGLFYYVAAQKDVDHRWSLTGVFIKDLTGRVFPFDEKEEVFQASKRLLKTTSYYYPGLNEIGLIFEVDQNSNVHFHSACSFFSLLKEMECQEKELQKKLLHFPIHLSDSILQKKQIYTPETTTQSEFDVNNKESLYRYSGQDIKVWVKFRVFEDEEMVIKIPNRIGKLLQKHPNSIKLGVKEEACQFILYEDPIFLKNNSFDYPIEIFASNSLLNKMQIPADFVYQMRLTGEKAVIGPTIGLLLGENNHNYHLKYMEKYTDRFESYHLFGGLTIAFSPRSVNWEEKIVYGMIYDHQKNNWRYGTAPIPSTIYRRNFHQNPNLINRLIEITDHQLFNSYHFTKSDLVFLKDEGEIKTHLPSTCLLNDMEELKKFIFDKKKVILKPVNLSRGRGIYIVEQNTEGLYLYDYKLKEKVEHRLENFTELQHLLEELGVGEQNYLYQTYIPLLKVDNRSFDVRVVMQKYNKMKWLCTGIECRVAQENEELTNIARGGEAMTLEEVLQKAPGGLSFSAVHNSILRLSQSFCFLMNKHDAHFAEFGLDVAVDETGFPWLLEANIFPSFKGFKHLEYDTYLRIRSQPLFYAVEIQGFQILDEEESKKPFIGNYAR